MLRPLVFFKLNSLFHPLTPSTLITSVPILPHRDTSSVVTKTTPQRYYISCTVRQGTMETRCFHKKLEFQRYPPNDLCTARYERKSSKKQFQTIQRPRKNTPGPILGQDRPEKNSAKCSFEVARFRVLDRHRATKPTTAP